jgi:fumarate hydratase class I
MIAGGNRSKQARRRARSTVASTRSAGVAALLSKESIRKVELVEYPELGMEAIYRLEVEDFPAVILVDDKGNDFFQKLA